MRFSFVFASLLAASPAVFASDFHDFKSSCIMRQNLFSGTTISMQCKGNDAQYHDTSVDLNRCVSNNDSGLECAAAAGQGGYGGSCKDCSLSYTWTGDGEPATLCCTCANLDSTQWKRSCLSLNTCLGNDNGAVSCG